MYLGTSKRSIETVNTGRIGKTQLKQSKMENKETAIKPKAPTLQGILTQENVRKRFEEILGKKSAGFISSVISATKSNQKLALCDPNSVVSSAIIAATLDLPIQPNLGFAAIIPYTTEVEGQPKSVAQFQMMYRGFIQLAMRTGQYKTMNVCEVYDGELVSENRFTGEYVFDSSKKKSDKVIGYTAYFKMVNGFEKCVYWTNEKIHAHAKRYSKTYTHKNGKWNTDFEAMASKTVLKLLLSKYGILSVDMQLQQAIIADQGVIKDADTLDIDYVDGEEKDEVVESETPQEKMAKMRELQGKVKKTELP